MLKHISRQFPNGKLIEAGKGHRRRCMLLEPPRWDTNVVHA